MITLNSSPVKQLVLALQFVSNVETIQRYRSHKSYHSQPYLIDSIQHLVCVMAGVPEDITLSTLPTTSSVEVEIIEESIQEEIHKQVESVVAETKEGQRPEIDVEERKKFSEV